MDEPPLPAEPGSPPEPPGRALGAVPPAIPPLPSLPNELKQDIRAKVSGDLYRLGVGSVVILLFIPLFMIALVAKYFIGRARRMQELAELKKKEAEVHNFSRQITEAKLQALLSKCIYSEHGFDALIRPVFEAVFHLLIVVSYCMPGSAECHAASAIQPMISRALTFSIVSPVFTARRSH